MQEDLEAVLDEVHQLGQDLKAEIVHQEEDGYMTREEHYPQGRPNYGTSDSCELIDVWVVTQERIAEPDREKRKAAEKELTEILEGGSRWYSARFLAAQYLMPFDGYNMGRIIHEQGRIAERFAHDFRFLNGAIENKDSLKRLKQDFDALYSMVPFKHIRKEMCRIMGYSYLRFAAMERPLAATAIAVTAAAASVSGIVYGLIEYFGGKSG